MLSTRRIRGREFVLWLSYYCPLKEGTMKVHELIARLERADPEDNVVFDPDSQVPADI